MEIHKPKPWHGVREFLKEYAIVVAGVLTALAGEQVVEAEHWHQKVEVVRSSLQGELANNRARWEADVASIRCKSREIEALDKWERGGSHGSPPPTPLLTDGLLLWMHNTNWNLATASQSLDHFPMREQLAYASMYAGTANRQAYIEKASDSFDRINTFRDAGKDAQAQLGLKLSLAALKQQFAVLVGDDNYMRRHFDDLGVHPDASDFRAELQRDPASGCFRTRT